MDAEKIRKISILKKERLPYLDFMKGIAVIAVIIDHSYGMLYSDQNIQLLTFFSVGIFVLVAGVTNTLSLLNNKGAISWKKYYLTRLRRLLVPYSIATSVVITLGYKNFNLPAIISALFHFNAQPPFYFIVFFLQLVFLAPFLFAVLYRTMASKYKYILVILETILITIAAYIFTKHTYILDVWGAGKVLFGGSFLVLFWFGMFWGFSSIKGPKTFLGYALGTVISCTIVGLYIPLVLWNKERLDTLFQIFPLWTKNPSGTPYLLYCLLLAFALWFLFGFASRYCGKLQFVFVPFLLFGRNSMTIFLYHYLFLRWMMPQFQAAIPVLQQQIWLYRTLSVMTSIGLPLLGAYLYPIVRNRIKKFIVLN